jgi:malate/lactate dehydrogenase
VNGKSALEQVDSTWYSDEFIPKVQKRGAAVIAARGLSSAASAAKATADHVHDWVQGSDGVVSMAVISDGNSYGVPAGLIYSFPVVCSNGSWKVVDGLAVNDFSRGKMDATAKELQEESAEAQEILASA